METGMNWGMKVPFHMPNKYVFRLDCEIFNTG